MSIDLQKWFRNRRVLITGGLGFIGANLAHRLVELGAQPVVLDHMSERSGRDLSGLKGIEHDVKVVVDDIRNIDAVRRVVADIDIIFNLAGQVSYTDSMSDPRRDFDASCVGHLTLLEACRAVNPAVRIIFSSSRMVYRKAPRLPVSEQEPTEPLTIYGVHKLTAEHYHRLYAAIHGIQTASLRIANPYGPRQKDNAGKYGIVNWFLRLAMRGEQLTIFGDGMQMRDYIYIGDLVEMLLRVAALPRLSGEVYNAGRGEGVRFRDMAEAVVSTVGAGSIRYVDWPQNYTQFESGDFVADIGRLREAIDYTPPTSLAEGLAHTLSFYGRSKEYLPPRGDQS